MSLSMHEIAEKRQCKSCGYADLDALEYNRRTHEAKKWEDTKAWCRYPFKLKMSDDLLTCFEHPDYIESKEEEK
jgi:hypothetical protein